MIKEIMERRSIRKFLPRQIDKTDILYIIESGIKAPSAKNRQPWKFIVIQGTAKEKMLQAFCNGVQREEKGPACLPGSVQFIQGARHTIEIMKQAPVIIFVLNTMGKNMFAPMTDEDRVFEVCNIQSVSAAVQNMLLAATERGIGSLWICDIYFAYQELCEWMDRDGELLAAIALGYSEEQPEPRPRKKIAEVVEWME
ncbi:nitroreductase family protein [Megasphaera paucivorans]|uniref:Nitroreductase n=1 Tax=Megasphaera paucivorans TaxID=349095 RepID=A0A1G9RPN1_9FIRM|nr:nitroreductase family protein [Megasphaera paucivorans]SDM25144.1 Nitroreductase [Megasphaera paucivorans]